MLRYALSYLATAATFLALDATWLTLMVDRLYRPRLGVMMADKPDLGAAAAFYLIYIAAILGLAVLPAASWRQVLTRAALFGLAAYATYDLTNQATLKSWSSMLSLADMAWGTFATTTAAAVGYLVARKLR